MYFFIHQKPYTDSYISQSSVGSFEQAPRLHNLIETDQQAAIYPVPTIPALNILGPPKCGTRTLIDMLSRYSNVVQFGSERGFFNGANKWRCYPTLNETAWIKYINDYNKDNQTLSTIVHIIQSHKNNKRCNTWRYRNLWNDDKRFNLTKRLHQENDTHSYRWQNIHCIHPKYAQKTYSPFITENIQFTSNLEKYCYLIEKGPSQSRVSWVPIVYANLLPKTKLLLILRNPIYHVMSAYVALHGMGSQKTHISVMEKKHLLIKSIDGIESFDVLNKMCHKMNAKWNMLNDKGIIGIKRYLKMKKTVYKNFIVTYLYRQFVYPKDIVPQPRNAIYIWAPFTFPTFLFALFAYDESLNNNIWNEWNEINSYRVVQFEWLFSDVSRSMKRIKCWMMDLNDIECDKHISDSDNQKIFATNIERRNHIHNASLTHERYEWYEENIHRLYGPCYQAMKNIIFYDRPMLLLGDWNSWNYTYTE